MVFGLNVPDMRYREIHQYAPQVSRNDAIGNELFALRSLLRDAGLKSEIYCRRTDWALRREVRLWSGAAAESGLLIAHFSHGSFSWNEVLSTRGPRVLLYHGVTPAAYFAHTHTAIHEASVLADSQLEQFRGTTELALAHSHFASAQLTTMGFRNVELIPYVFRPASDLDVHADPSVLRCYGADGRTNFLVVGRIAPHKCIEDAIVVFDYIKRFLDKSSRLIVVGSWSGTENYLIRLRKLIRQLGVSDVLFTGPVPEEHLSAYYRVADGLLSMSQHEGFGVPLVEAMHFGVPVFAYACTAVPETLRGAGMLFANKSWPVIAEEICRLLSDNERRARMIEDQKAAAEYYSEANARERISALLRQLDSL